MIVSPPGLTVSVPSIATRLVEVTVILALAPFASDPDEGETGGGRWARRRAATDDGGHDDSGRHDRRVRDVAKGQGRENVSIHGVLLQPHFVRGRDGGLAWR